MRQSGVNGYPQALFSKQKAEALLRPGHNRDGHFGRTGVLQICLFRPDAHGIRLDPGPADMAEQRIKIAGDLFRQRRR
jgi:hypothetical protein